MSGSYLASASLRIGGQVKIFSTGTDTEARHGHRRSTWAIDLTISLRAQKELSGLEMCCSVARLERCDIVMLQPAPPSVPSRLKITASKQARF